MDAPELPFEYCALRFLLQWEQRERSLHEYIAGSPTLPQLRSALRYFQVARTFAGLKTDEAAQAVSDALLQIDSERHDSPEQKVTALAERFRQRFNQFNLSAASKLLWLKHKEPYVIYDSRAVNALRDLGCIFENANYGQYSVCWRNEYRKRKEAIAKAASRLRDVLTFFSHWHQTEADLASLASQAWFLERVFDIYLWELGGEG